MDEEIERLRARVQSLESSLSVLLDRSNRYDVEVFCCGERDYEWRVIRKPLHAPQLIAGGVAETYESALKRGWDEVASIRFAAEEEEEDYA